MTSKKDANGARSMLWHLMGTISTGKFGTQKHLWTICRLGYYGCHLAGLLQNGKRAQNQKCPAKWPAAIFRRRLKMAAAENPQILAGQLFVRPFFGHFGTPPPPKNGRRPFRRPFLSHFRSGPVSHSVAGQPSRNTMASVRTEEIP